MADSLQHMAAILVVAIAVDLLYGEPPSALHPVVWFGALITACLAMRPREQQPWSQFVFGLLVAVLLPSLVAAVAYLLLNATRTWPWLHLATGAWLLTSSFSIRALGAAADVVRRFLYRGDLSGARVALGHLCSRDAATLDADEVAGATIESVAENCCDSFIAPLFYFLLFGVPGAVAYRCINTLDSRLGYRGKFEYLGKASARLDDIVNLIPARLSAALFLLSGFVLGARVRPAISIWRRDRNQTDSPNAGHSMSMMAGLLGLRLEKRGCYSLGDPIQRPGAASIAKAWHIVFGAILFWIAISLGGLLV